MTRVAALEVKTQFMSVGSSSGVSFTRFTNCNLQILSGSGSTDGVINGKGNLIIGYNTGRGDPANPDIRTGSHNLVLGNGQNYSSFGGFVAGYANTISGRYSSVSGGIANRATGDFAAVTGGQENQAIAYATSVSGGAENQATSFFASVSGGLRNKATGSRASVSGGAYNTASGQDSSASGGLFNTASGPNASISGGGGWDPSMGNVASGAISSISGGNSRTTPDFTWVGGNTLNPQ